MSVLVLSFTLFGCISILTAVNGQIPPGELPPDLQFVKDTELGDWKAPDELHRLCPYYLSGFDDEDRPIWVIEMGIWPTRDILEKGKDWEEAYDKYSDQMVKKIFDSVALRSTPENPIKEYNLIIDLDNYTLRHFSSVKAARFVTRRFQQVTSGMKFGNEVYIVNANSFSEVIINLLKPILGQGLEKIEIFGTNSAKWIPKLVKVFPKNQLSEKYGGDKGFKPVQAYG